LKQLRKKKKKKKKKRLLWADAVCINQRADEEKSKQKKYLSRSVKLRIVATNYSTF
jgi:hypothetical protein